MIQSFPPLQFRFAQPANAGLMAQIYIDCVDPYLAGKPDKRRMHIEEEERKFLHNSFDDSKTVLLAYIGDRGVGFMRSFETTKNGLHATHFYTLKTPGYSIGSGIIKETCLQIYPTKISLTPSQTSITGYERLGFIWDGPVMSLMKDNMRTWRSRTHGDYPRFKI